MLLNWIFAFFFVCGLLSVLLLILETLLAVSELGFKDLERIDDFWTLLLLLLEFIYLVH